MPNRRPSSHSIAPIRLARGGGGRRGGPGAVHAGTAPTAAPGAELIDLRRRAARLEEGLEGQPEDTPGPWIDT